MDAEEVLRITINRRSALDKFITLATEERDRLDTQIDEMKKELGIESDPVPVKRRSSATSVSKARSDEWDKRFTDIEQSFELIITALNNIHTRLLKVSSRSVTNEAVCIVGAVIIVLLIFLSIK